MKTTWRFYNPNPVSLGPEDDCAVRAVSAALGVSWDEAYEMISRRAQGMGKMMHSNAAWGSVLRQHGFVRAIIPNTCPDCYTAADFARDHPSGTYLLGFYGHVAAVIDGQVWDSFDSTAEVPIFYWYRR